MIDTLKIWLNKMWQPTVPETLEAYNVTFSTYHGQLVLQHLMDSVYCQVYSGTDPHAALAHNARRTVIHEILENIDGARHPQKYQMKVEETTHGFHA